MAKKKKNSSDRRKYTILVTFVVVALALVGVAFFIQHKNNDKRSSKDSAPAAKQADSIDYSPSTPEDNAPNDARKSSKNPTDTLTDNPDASHAPLSAKIVNATVSGTNLHVGTLVVGATSGTCTLTASSAGKQVALATSSIKQNVNNYDCGVFNISTSAFPSSGSWQLTLTASNGTSQASDSTTVTIPGGQ